MPAILRSHPLFFEALVDAHVVAFASSKIGFYRNPWLPTLVKGKFHPIAMLVRQFMLLFWIIL